MRHPLSTLLLFAAVVPAQSVVVPNANATVSATTVLNNPMRNAGAARTYMMGINASELAAIPPGSLITGISMRAGHTGSNPAVWPANNAVTFNDYEVTVGNVIPTATWTNSFMGNFTGTPVMARDGFMLVPQGIYQNVVAAPTANPWGEFYWDFQVPFLYTGGDLGVLMTHPGSNDPTSIFFEQVPSNTAVHGQAITQSSTFQATTASTMNYAFCVIRVHYGYGSPAGCPGTGGMTPMLVQNGNVTGGGQILLSTANAPANALGLYVFGYGRLTLPLPNGCNLLTSPLGTSLALLDGNGRHLQAINVPPTVTGTFNAQILVLDAGNPGGFTASNAVEPAAF